jgi:hypothetical protein
LEAWSGFFAAQVASAAALAGLLFVALSVNLTRILQYPWLPARAAQTLVVLMAALIESSVALFPVASARPAADAICGMSIFAYIFAWRLSEVFQKVRPDRRTRPDAYRPLILNIAVFHLATVPQLAGSLLVIAANANGYYWIATGVTMALVFGMFNSWVLLVEILR